MLTIPLPGLVELQEILKVQRRLAEEMIAALGAKLKQRTLDRADAGLRHIAIFEGQFVRPLPDIDQHRLQVVEVEEHQPFLVGDVEGDGENAFLDLVEVHQPGQQQAAPFR